MNQSLLFILVLTICSYSTKSQTRYGIKAGLNLANQTKTISIPQVPSAKQNTKPLIGPQIGVFYKANLNKRVLIAAEANFSVIGSSMMLTTSDGNSYNAHEKLGYIEVPLTVLYRFARIYFGAGPSVGFKVYSKITNFENGSFNIPYYQTVDAAGNLLAGYTVTKNLDLNARYSHGIVNLYKDPGYGKAKNRFFNFSILYTLK